MNSRRQLLLALGAGALAVMLLLGYLIWAGYQKAMQAAEVTTRNYASIIEARLDATLRRTDASLQELVGEIPIVALNKQAPPRYASKINYDLRGHMFNFPELAGLRVTDASGERLYTSDRTDTPHTQLADRDYFRELRDNPGADLVFSEVIVSRVGGRPSVVAARALRDRQGAFRGIVFAVIELEYFQKLFQLLDIGSDGSVSVYRSDQFSEVVRWPLIDQKPNTRLPPDSQTRKLFVGGNKIATVENLSRRDGILRIYSYQLLDRYPFFVAVGFSREHILAEWRTRSIAVGLSGLWLLGVLAGLLFRLWRSEGTREQAMAGLVQSEGRFRALFDRAAEGIMIVTPDGKLVAVNQSFALMHGHTTEEMQTVNLKDLDTPDNFRLVPERMQRLLAGEALTFEVEHFHRDGHLFPLEVSASLIASEGEPLIQAFHRDITDRKRAEDALWKTIAFRESLSEAMPLPVFHKDVSGRYTGCNSAFARFIGKTKVEIIGKTLFEISPQNFANTYRDKDLDLLDVPTGTQTYESKVASAEGGIRDVIFHKARLTDGAGSPTGIVGVITDISELKQIHAKQVLLESQLRESQKMEALGTLAGGIAHDFNNIVAAILGNTELARQDSSANPVALESLEEIRKAGTRARDLVRQILAFSRREPTQREPIALATVVEESAHLLSAMLPARVIIEAHCDAGVPLVNADYTQIQQIVVNLATNAMQAMHGDPGHIVIRLDTVMLDAALAGVHPALDTLHQKYPGRTVRLVVNDDGPGMEAAIVERIFEPFFTTKPVGEGTGLGLSVVHGIVQLHQGAIVAESTPGQGATFTIYLPVAAGEHLQTDTPSFDLNAVTAAATPITTPALNLNGGQHILYLDDDESLVFLVKRLLERRGYRVSAYINQSDALAALRADPVGFDLVLTDYNMPGMSGLDVAREVRAIRADLPVAIASGFIDETLRAEAEGAGARELVFKADVVEEFCAVVQRLAQTVVTPSKDS